MTFKLEYPTGVTPLSREEIEGLIPSDISNHEQLNQAEQTNIIEAEVWAFRSKRRDVLNEEVVKELHRRMFKNVWKWAGKYRRSDKNIGVQWASISVEILKLIKDTEYWIEHSTFQWPELAARFHHRLVFIHPFPNGNGRHARLMTDILLTAHEKNRFSWGSGFVSGSLRNESEVRAKYIEALRDADQRKYQKLIDFVES